MLSYNHRQRKSRNLSYTNQFKRRRSLTSTGKIKEKQQNILLLQLVKVKNKKGREKKAECPRNQINSLEKFQSITGNYQSKN